TSGIPITGVGLDVTEKCRLEGSDLDRLKGATAPSAQFLYRLIQLWQQGNPNRFPTLHDPLAVGTALRSTLVETQTGSVQVEIASPQLYGTTVFTRDDKGSTRVARNVNPREFLDLFIERVSAAPRVKP
ncbi:MAG: nucleoside hydrolase, partial [Acidobacteriota bacterium]|nr:nucleoside hydrolase [Acidobacteriota bacterium]